MKIGTTISLFEKGWQSRLSPLLKMGFDYFELLPENETIIDLDELKRFLGSTPIILHAPFVEANIISISPEIRQASYRYYDRQFKSYTQLFNPSVITMHVGSTAYYYGKLTFKEIKLLMKNYPQIVIENMPSSGNIWREPYPNTTLLLDYALKQLGCNLTFDVGHWIRMGEDPIAMFLKYKDKIKNIHIHDVVGEKDHLELGIGKLKLLSFIKELKKDRYAGYLTIELVPDDSVGLKRSLIKLREFM